MRQVGERELEEIAIGAAILGTGGGGDPYVGALLAREAIRKYGPVEIVPPNELKDDDFVVPIAIVGAPTILLEKPPRGEEFARCFLAHERFVGRKATHTVSAEIGGMNSVTPLILAAQLRIPVVDADAIGRAYPEIHLTIPSLMGVSSTPSAICDEKGNTVFVETINDYWTEQFDRATAVVMGSVCAASLYAMSGAEVKRTMVHGTLTLAWKVGHAVLETKAAHGDVIEAIKREIGGHHLFQGRVVDFDRRVTSGWVKATAKLDGLGPDKGVSGLINTQNEHLVVRRDGEVICSVPDLIVVLDTETGMPITTEMLRYGDRITVIGSPPDPRWRTPAGIERGGPRHFGYDFDYIPVEERVAALNRAG